MSTIALTLTRHVTRFAGRLDELDRRAWVMLPMTLGLALVVVRNEGFPMPVLLAGLGVLAAGLWHWCRKSPELSLYVLAAYMPFSHALVGDFGGEIPGFNLTNVLLAWTVFTYVLSRRHASGPRAPLSGLHLVLLVYLGMCLMSLIWAGWTYGGWYWREQLIPLKRFLVPVSMAFLAYWIVRDVRTLKTVLAVMMVSVAVIALASAYEYMDRGGGTFNHSRVGAIASDPNVLGAFFVTYMFLFAALLLERPKEPQGWAMILPFLLCARGIMVTFSRGAYVAFAAAALALSWFKSKRLFLAALAVGALAVLNPVLLPSGIRYRMGQTLEQKPQANEADLVDRLEPSAGNRLVIWRGAVAMIREHPLRGVGFGAFPEFLTQYTDGEMGYKDAHNIYLRIAGELGLPALLVFLGFLGMAGRMAWRVYRRSGDPVIRALGLGFLAGLVGLCVSNSFSSSLWVQEMSAYFWILCGLVARAAQFQVGSLKLEARSWN